MIHVQQLTFTYPNQGLGKSPIAIKGISFDAHSGEIFGFLGPSGAGKTTSQKLLMGLLRGYQGSIRVLGKERSDWKNDFYEHVGVAFDFPAAYGKLTALENLQLVSNFYKKSNTNAKTTALKHKSSRPELEPMALLERVGLLADAHKHVEAYSKGMKMRFNFIRALLHDPQILFLDEPTSGLDPNNSKTIKEMMLEERDRGKCIFLTTHDMNTASALCGRVALIDDGLLKALDTPEALRRSFGQRNIRVQYLNERGVEDTSTFDLDALATNVEFHNLIARHQILSIHSAEATLEDVFIKLTGKELHS